MGVPYSYLCEDRSVFLPFYKRYVWEPALAWVPEDVSPNSLSLLGNVCSVLAFVSLLVLSPEQHYLFLFPAVMTFLYLCLDNLDGMHARRTGKSSPLGEFLDHWFDSFNCGFLVLGLFHTGRLPPMVQLVLLGVTNMAYFATMWEQRHTGVITMGRAGQIEGVTTLSCLYLGIALFGHDLLAVTPLFGLLSVIEFCAVFLGLAYLFTVGGCIWRTRRAWGEWLPLLFLTGCALVWYQTGRVDFFPVAFLLLLANAVFGGRHVLARVLGRAYKPLDTLLVGGLALALVASLAFDPSAEIQTGTGWLLVVLVFGRLGYDFFTTVNALRQHIRPGEFLDRAFVRRKRPG
jgi:phosphatidylglycerophosphate synthase